MASILPYTSIVQSFSGVVAGGSGTIVQWTYTVPAGKRAILCTYIITVGANGNAVATTIGSILAVGNFVDRLFRDGAGNATLDSERVGVPKLNLVSGQTIVGQTTNTGAAGVGMLLQAIIEEYG